MIPATLFKRDSGGHPRHPHMNYQLIEREKQIINQAELRQMFLYGSSGPSVSPGDDTASIVKGPNSALSGTQQEPPTHAGPPHCPAPVSLVPVKQKQRFLFKKGPIYVTDGEI